MLRSLEPHSVYHQNITQHSGVLNASQTGNVFMQQMTVAESSDLRTALAEVRSALKQQGNSIDVDESVGLLASAEKAAQQGDESKVLACLKQVPEKAWDIGKAVIPQILLSYLKAHGLISA